MSFKHAIFTLSALFGLLSVSMIGLGLGPHSALLLSLTLLCVLSLLSGTSWESLEKGMKEGISQGAGALIILGMIGITVSTWNLGGTIPTLLSYGLEFFSPRFFLPSSLLLCILISSFTGSSLTTCATIGTALMGIGHALGVNPAALAGAIISGAFFGDKMSPLSDTTNFAPGIVGVDLYAHIKGMTYSTIPSLILSFVFFFYLSGHYTSVDTEKLRSMQEALHSSFQISPLCLLPALLVLFLALFKRPVITTLTWGVTASFACAGLVQNNWNLELWFNSLYSGLNLPIPQEDVAWIVNRGGIESMLFTISLVCIALIFGGVLQESGLIKALQKKVHSLSLKKRGLSLLSTSSSFFVNLLTGEQYLSILIPGQLFKESFDKAKVNKTYLTRSLEDGGTLINPLIPWGVCGTFISAQLGVAVLDYAPYAVFLYLCPLFTLLFSLFKKD